MLFADRPVLMVVSDRHASTRPVPVLARLALAGGADLFQVREKDLAEAEVDELVRQTIVETGSAERILVNGLPAIAERHGTGLHLPEQSNVDIESLTLAPGSLLGRSVHQDTNLDDCDHYDYVIAGHLFSTASKPGLPPLGLTGLAGLIAKSPVPVLAIGGVSPQNAGEAVAAGASGVAVMSSINVSNDPFNVTQRYRDALDKSWESRHAGEQ